MLFRWRISWKNPNKTPIGKKFVVHVRQYFTKTVIQYLLYVLFQFDLNCHIWLIGSDKLEVLEYYIHHFPPLIPHSFLHFRLSCNLSAVSAKDSVFLMNCRTYKSLFFTLSTSRWSYSFFSRKSVTKTINRARCNHLYIISIRKQEMCASQNMPIYINYPIYRTKVIMWKRPCCQKFYL